MHHGTPWAHHARQGDPDVLGIASSLLAGKLAGSKLLHKGMFLTPAEAASLSVEQLALIDLLMAQRAQSFVGLDGSVGSWLVHEYRHLYGSGNTVLATSSSQEDVEGVQLLKTAGVFASRM